uniref:WD_REPEATS_REGION domain-containing protein n=1 Tax=Enterobius vermicularis TaxID=51028 RepID=A0A0N4UYP4_ENTVE
LSFICRGFYVLVATNTGIPRPPVPNSIESAPPPTPTVSQAPPVKRREIYRYTSSRPLFASDWSSKTHPDKRWRVAVGTFVEDKPQDNKVHIIQLDEQQGDLVERCSFEHFFPPNCIRWIPDPQNLYPDILATSCEVLRIYRVDNGVQQECVLNNKQAANYSGPLTSFDWNDVDPSLIGTASIDMSCTIWQIETGQSISKTKRTTGNVKTQLIAHDKPVHDIGFSKIGNGRDNFATVGADGSARLFDLRNLQHSTIVYEDPLRTPLMRLAWNKQDSNYLATFAEYSVEVVIIDIRVPCSPVARLRNHRGCINALTWAPHSGYHICTAADDRQALIWDLSSVPRPVDDPILAYQAGGEVRSIKFTGLLLIVTGFLYALTIILKFYVSNSHCGHTLNIGWPRKEPSHYAVREVMTNLPVSNLSLQQHRSFMDEHSSLQRAFASNQSLQRFGEQEGFHVSVLRLDEVAGEFIHQGTFDHPYPATKIMWIPDTKGTYPDLLGTTGDYLRLWRVGGENGVHVEALFNNNKSSEYCAPLTSFDWNDVDLSLIGTSSIDTTCTVWQIETGQVIGTTPKPTEGSVKTQLIAHDKEVFDIGFTRMASGREIFASVGADGSVRMFDLRHLEHSTIIYEEPTRSPLLRLVCNKQDHNYIATVAQNSNEVIILDVRIPSSPVAKLNNHRAQVNGMAWAPHSSCHICTAGDDNYALIWDLHAMPRPVDDPILAYQAGGEVNQIHWAQAYPDWISICYDQWLEILRV